MVDLVLPKDGRRHRLVTSTGSSAGRSNGVTVCLGVEVQFSSCSDLMIIDVCHLRDQVLAGSIDAGCMVVPADRLGTLLVDQGPKFSDALVAVPRAVAEDLALIVLGVEHDGERVKPWRSRGLARASNGRSYSSLSL